MCKHIRVTLENVHLESMADLSGQLLAILKHCLSSLYNYLSGLDCMLQKHHFTYTLNWESSDQRV